MRPLRLLLLVALATAASACTVKTTIDGFACTSDEDCLANLDYFCGDIGETGIGICVLQSIDQRACDDRDNDGAFAGTTCLTDGIAPETIDCNDTDPTIFPGASEICDANADGPIDNDCDGLFDENETGDGLVRDRLCPLQAGLCLNSTVACDSGVYPPCTAGIGYPSEFGEDLCDGEDNDCDAETDEDCCPDVNPPADCLCSPGQAFACGSDTGTCTRGLRLCPDSAEDGGPARLTDCVVAEIGSACITNTDCGDEAYCVAENLSPHEDLFDNCTTTNPSGCARSICRHLIGTVTCDSDASCAADELCVDGSCQQENVGAMAEACNGLDDDCNGRIDNDGDRINICGSCPFNSVLTPVNNAAGNRLQICVDQYEASRPDATSTDAGSFEYYPLPRPGVIPWTGVTPAEAATACQGTEYAELFGSGFAQPLPRKRLCITYEYRQACGGTDATASQTDFPYGDDYISTSCWDNAAGISEPQATGTRDSCCRQIATGTIQGSQSTCDMSGNVGEWVTGVSNLAELAGGSYQDGGAGNLGCGTTVPATSIPEPYGNYVGFRCCTLRSQ